MKRLDDATVLSESAEETEALGERLVPLLPPGTVVALHGDLAAGKTCLVRGMARAFHNDAVHSPTFTLVNEYGTGDIRLYHVDLYRLQDPGELAELGYEDILDPRGICALEWPERAEGLLPDRRLDIFLEHRGDHERQIRLQDIGGVLRMGALEALLQECLRSPV
jgi:tRNA threonylcarbamoyladenosine biosynthesis protein TsaE